MIEYKTELDFQKFLNTIAYAMCTNKSDWTLFNSIGVNPIEWPVSYENPAKKSLADFSTLLKSKPYEFASLEIKSRYEGFRAFEIMHDFPTDVQDLAIIYKHNVEAWRAYYLAQAIIKDKFRHEEIKARTQTSIDTDFFFTVKDNIEEFFIDKEKQIKDKKTSIILPDWPILSEQIGGFNPQRLTMIAAQSGFGKTRLAVNLSLSAIKIAPVYYFNMEMGKNDFTQLFIQAHTGLTYKQINKGDYVYHPERVQAFKQHLEKNHHLNATSGRAITIEKLIAKASVHAKENPMSFIIVDYDQKIISDSKGEEWMAVLKAIEKLEDVAKETNSHVIILAQGNDDGEAKSSKRAKQPVSAFLSFMKDEQGVFYLKATKNRWGKPNIEVAVSVDPESGKMCESHLKGDLISEAIKPRDLFAKDRIKNHAQVHDNKAP